jgi:hypothetical protein
MNKTLLSLCLFGAALATANILIMQRPTCPSGADVVAAFKETAPAPVSPTNGKPGQGPKAAKALAPKNKAATPGSRKPKQTSKATAKSAATPKGVDQTASIKSSQGSDQKQAKVPRKTRKSAQARSYGWNRHDRYYGPEDYYWPPEYEYYGPPVIRIYPGW